MCDSLLPGLGGQGPGQLYSPGHLLVVGGLLPEAHSYKPVPGVPCPGDAGLLAQRVPGPGQQLLLYGGGHGAGSREPLPRPAHILVHSDGGVAGLLPAAQLWLLLRHVHRLHHPDPALGQVRGRLCLRQAAHHCGHQCGHHTYPVLSGHAHQDMPDFQKHAPGH